jgi:hypothetical protein
LCAFCGAIEFQAGVGTLRSLGGQTLFSGVSELLYLLMGAFGMAVRNMDDGQARTQNTGYRNFFVTSYAIAL